MEILVGVVIGIVAAGALVVAAGALARRRSAEQAATTGRTAEYVVEQVAGELAGEVRRLADEQRVGAEAARDAAISAALEHLMTSGKALMDTERELAGRDLEGKKGLIDQQLAAMHTELARVGDLVRELEADRGRKFGELAQALDAQRADMARLAETTQGLRQALSSTKARGQWGERMAEDVLQLAGFLEGVNYHKQRAIDTGIPDFTFLLPDGLSLHMDVKFPLDNYLRYLDAESDLERRRARDEFLRDVRNHVKSLAARGYLDGSSATVDCVLLFIPNEQLYAFIQEQDRTILDDALRRKLVFCSPLTLYAVLAVVRQAVDNFRVERTSSEILTRLGAFTKQWDAFVDKMDKLDRSLTTARRDFDELTGTRRRMLERELDKIDDLRRSNELAPSDPTDVVDGPADPPLALEA
jgi:DNA recombination protein RmuC